MGAEIEIYIAQGINSSCLAQFCLQHCDLGLPLIGFFCEAGKPIMKGENGRRIEKILFFNGFEQDSIDLLMRS